MQIEKDKLYAIIRLLVVISVIIILSTLYFFKTFAAIKMAGCAAALIYSILALLLAGKIDRRMYFYLTWLFDLFLATLTIYATGGFKSPFLLLFLLLILSFSLGQSVASALLSATIISSIYLVFFLTRGTPNDLPKYFEMSNIPFIIVTFFSAALMGLWTSSMSTDEEENKEETAVSPTPSANPDIKTDRTTQQMMWQIPKTVDEAYVAMKRLNEEKVKLAEAFQIERQKNNTIRQIAHDVATQKDIHHLYEDVISKTRREISSQSAFLMRFDSGKLNVKYYDGSLSEITMHVFESSEVLYEVMSTGNSIRLGIENIELMANSFAGTHEKIKNLLCVPLKTLHDSKPFGLMGLANYLMGGDFTDEHEEYLRLITIEAAIAMKNIEYISDLEKSYDEITLALARAIEAKDDYTHDHVDRVREYSEQLAIALGLPEDEIKLIRKAATLHDVGKISTPEHILRKEKALDDEEWKKMKDHAKASVRILKGISSLEKEVLNLVMHHHERYDGKGYPDGLKGENIPVGARIIAVADTYDAMTSDRPYRKGFPEEVALKKMREECMGTQFDAAILEAFIKMMTKKIIRKKKDAEPDTFQLRKNVIQDGTNPELRPRILDINLTKKGIEP